jgi:hypothetical protein
VFRNIAKLLIFKKVLRLYVVLIIATLSVAISLCILVVYKENENNFIKHNKLFSQNIANDFADYFNFIVKQQCEFIGQKIINNSNDKEFIKKLLNHQFFLDMNLENNNTNKILLLKWHDNIGDNITTKKNDILTIHKDNFNHQAKNLKKWQLNFLDIYSFNDQYFIKLIFPITNDQKYLGYLSATISLNEISKQIDNKNIILISNNKIINHNNLSINIQDLEEYKNH